MRFLLLGIVLGSVAFDQLTKVVAIQKLKGQFPLLYWSDFFRLEYAENRGAFLNLGAALSPDLRFWILSIAVAGFLGMLLVYLIRNPKLNRVQYIALSFVLGGGVSNLLDRLFRNEGRVVDFMNMGIGSLRTGIFNFADVFILFGILVYLALNLSKVKDAH